MAKAKKKFKPLCYIVLLSNAGDIDTVDTLEEGNHIFLWCNPHNIAGVIEMNYKIRELRKKTSFLNHLVIIDLHKAGYPPMNAERITEECIRIAEMYVESASEIYDAELINFINKETIND